MGTLKFKGSASGVLDPPWPFRKSESVRHRVIVNHAEHNRGCHGNLGEQFREPSLEGLVGAQDGRNGVVDEEALISGLQVSEGLNLGKSQGVEMSNLFSNLVG